MKALIIYSSQTGFTEKYSNWIAKDLQADCISIKKAKNINLSEYDTIIYGGWCCAGSINGLNWFNSKIAKLPEKENKKIVIFGVGASPIENPDVAQSLEKITNTVFSKIGKQLETLKVFYCPGGFNYEKMNTPSKIAMKMFIKMLESNKNKTEKDEVMIKMISGSYDISDKRHIQPILDFVK